MSNFKFRTWPTEFRLITQHFGARPWVYQEFGFPGHEGIDFQAPTGSKVFAVAPGVVSEVFAHNGQHNYGNHIRVQHEDGYETVYAHLHEIGVQPGQKVRSGQVVGLAGETGFVEGAHLHLTLRRQGESAPGYPRNVIDPTPFVMPLIDKDWDDATFVRDTVPDGTVLGAGQVFVQSWTLRNSGHSTWEDGYTLVHVAGERMEAPEQTPLPPAPPGAEAPVAVLLRTPTTPGRFRSTFQPSDPAGNRFGDPVWAEIEVVAPSGLARGTGATPRLIGCQGGELRRDGRAFRFFGVNLRGLIHYGRMGEDPLKHSRPEHRLSQLRAAYDLGARVVRIFLADKNAATAEIVQRLQETLAIVKTHFADLYLLPVFTNLYNDVPFYVAGDGKFYANTGGRDLLNRDFFAGGFRENYLPFVRSLVTAFADEPHILAWGIGNELKLDRADKANPDDPNPWTFVSFNHEVAAEIKRLDRNHLVTTGMKSTHHAWLHSAALQDALYRSPNIDFITIHSYEGLFDGEGDRRVWDDAALAQRLGKPFIVEEAGFDIRAHADRAPKYREHIDKWGALGSCGYMPWGFIHAHEIGDGDKFVGFGSNVADFDVLCGLFRNVAGPLVAASRGTPSFIAPSAQPRGIGLAGFDFQEFNRQFMARPGLDPVNDAPGYGVRVGASGAASGETYWRVIGIHHLTPDENKRRHNVYVDVLDEGGQRVRDPNLRLAFNWENNTEPPPEAKRLDKPDNEPATDVPLDKEATYRVWVTGAGPSEVVADLHTRHADENDSQGVAQNTVGHHSYYVVFQRTRQAAPVVDGGAHGGATSGAGPLPTPPAPAPPTPAPTPAVLTRAKDKLGIDANRPIDPATGAIAPQVADPAIIAGAGVGWVRLNFVLGERWSSPLDPNRPQGLTWAESYGRIIDGLRGRGVKVYGLISDEAVHGSHNGQLRGAPGSASAQHEWVNAYVRNFVEIVRLFHNQIAVFESFNEPDDWKRNEVPGWSDGAPNLVHPDWFAILLQRIHQAVKSDPTLAHVKLVSGPLQGLDVNDNAGVRYLQRVYEAGQRFFNWGQPGSPVPFDGVGYHLYIAEGERVNVRQALRDKYNRYMTELRDVIRGQPGGDKPIYLSEVGWANDGSLDHLQHEALESAIDAILNDQSVALGIWFCTQDFPGKPYGLYRTGDLAAGNRKSIHDTFKALCELPLPGAPTPIQPVTPLVVTPPPVIAVQWFGVVTAALLNVRLGPGVEHVQIGSLAEGAGVEVVGHVGEWLLVNANGQQGFVHGNFVRPVPLAMGAPPATPRGPAAPPAQPVAETAPQVGALWRQYLVQNLEQSQTLFQRTLAETMDPQWLRRVMEEHLLLISSLHLIYNGYWARLAFLADPANTQAELSTITQETLTQMQTLLASRQGSAG